MKTLSSLSLAAALVAAFALPVQIEVTGSVLFGAAILAFAATDYSPRRQAVPARRRPFTARAQFHRLWLATEANRLAA